MDYSYLDINGRINAKQNYRYMFGCLPVRGFDTLTNSEVSSPFTYKLMVDNKQ